MGNCSVISPFLSATLQSSISITPIPLSFACHSWKSRPLPSLRASSPKPFAHPQLMESKETLTRSDASTGFEAEGSELSLPSVDSDGDKMSNAKDIDISAVWDRDTKIIFCDLCLKEVDLGNRPTTHFNRDGWRNILKSFHEKTGIEYNKVQLKNKWDQIKKDWKLWKELKRDSTGGLGWDPIRKTIAASEEWWMEKLQVVPNGKKFRFAGIDPELEEKLNRMFTGVVATGEHVWTPAMGTMREKSPIIAINEEGINESNGEFEGIHASRSQSRAPLRKRKKKVGGDFLRDQIAQLVATCSSWTSTPTITKEKTTTRATITDAVRVLDGIPEVCNDIEFYVSCIRELEDPVKCEAFIALLPERRVPYLRFCCGKSVV